MKKIFIFIIILSSAIGSTLYGNKEVLSFVDLPKDEPMICYNVYQMGESYPSGQQYCKGITRNIIFDGDKVYVERMLSGWWNWWMEGRLKDGKLIFKSNKKLGQHYYFPEFTQSTFTVDSVFMFTYEPGNLNPNHDPGKMYFLTEDFALDYDPENKTFSNPNHWYGIKANGYREGDCWTPGYSWECGDDRFYQAEQNSRSFWEPCESGSLIPKAPEIEKYDKGFKITGDRYSVDGKLMPVKNLYYKVYVNGKEKYFSLYYDELGNKNSGTKIPYNIMWENGDEKPRSMIFTMPFNTTEDTSIYVVMVYNEKYGVEWVSERAYLEAPEE